MAYGNPKNAARGSKRSHKKTSSKSGIGSPLGHRGISGAYGKPMMMKAPSMKKAARSR